MRRKASAVTAHSKRRLQRLRRSGAGRLTAPSRTLGFLFHNVQRPKNADYDVIRQPGIPSVRVSVLRRPCQDHPAVGTFEAPDTRRRRFNTVGARIMAQMPGDVPVSGFDRGLPRIEVDRKTPGHAHTRQRLGTEPGRPIQRHGPRLRTGAPIKVPRLGGLTAPRWVNLPAQRNRGGPVLCGFAPFRRGRCSYLSLLITVPVFLNLLWAVGKLAIWRPSLVLSIRTEVLSGKS